MGLVDFVRGIVYQLCGASSLNSKKNSSCYSSLKSLKIRKNTVFDPPHQKKKINFKYFFLPFHSKLNQKEKEKKKKKKKIFSIFYLIKFFFLINFFLLNIGRKTIIYTNIYFLGVSVML